MGNNEGLGEEPGALLDEMAAGTHIVTVPAEDHWPELKKVVESWRLGIISMTTELAQVLHVDEDLRQVHQDYKRFDWPTPENLAENYYVKFARDGLLPLARRLICDYEAQVQAVVGNLTAKTRDKPGDPRYVWPPTEATSGGT